MSLLSKFKTDQASKTVEYLTFDEYLELCKTDKMAYATAAERMLAAIGEPELISRLFDVPVWPGRVLGFVFLAGVALYILGSLLKFKTR